MTLTSRQIGTFLETLNAGLRGVKSEWQHREIQTSPRFSAFELFDPGEVNLTAITAKLLRPDAEHGQGSRFLEAFLSESGVKVESDLDRAQISVNHCTSTLENAQRKPDLVIRLADGFHFALESKSCGASDQENQVSDYLRDLRARSPKGYKLLYLSGGMDDTPPSEASISTAELNKAKREQHLDVRCYSEFMKEWLGRCIKLCRSERVHEFLDEFLRYLPILSNELQQETYMTSQDARDSVVNTVLSKSNYLEASLAVYMHFGAVWSKVFNDFVVQLEQKLRKTLSSTNAGWVVKPSATFSENWGGIGFWKRSWGDLYHLAIEFGQNGKDRKKLSFSPEDPPYLCAYVERDDKKGKRTIPELDTALASLNLQKKPSDWLYWLGFFRKPYNDLTSVDSIRAMQSGRAAAEVADILVQLAFLAEPILDKEASRSKNGKWVAHASA